MTAYSHRDLRVFRAAHRRIALVAGVTVALLGLAMLLPWTGAAFVAVIALAALGGVVVIDGGRLVEEYVGDLREVRGGHSVDGSLRAEVVSFAAFDPLDTARSRASPHSRRGRSTRTTDADVPAWATTTRLN